MEPCRHRRRTPALLALALAVAAMQVWLPSHAGAQVVDVAPFHVGDGINRLDVAGGAGNRFAAVWVRFVGSGRQVFSRVFAADGTPLTGATRIDHDGRLTDVSIAGLANGGYAVAAQHITSSSNLDAVYYLRLGDQGARLGAPIRLDSDEIPGPGVHPAVAALAQGPVFAWREHLVRSRRYGSGGAPLEPVRQVSETAPSGFYVGVATLANGGYVVAWHASFPSSVWGRIFDAAGSPVGDSILLGEQTLDERIAGSPLGGFGLVAARNGTEVWSRRFDDLGSPAGDWVLVGATSPAIFPRADIAFDPQGNALVVWSGYIEGSPVFGPLQARVLGALHHQPLGPAVTIANQGYNVRTSRLADGRFVGIWQHSSSKIHAAVVSVCGAGVPLGCGDGIVEEPCELCDDGPANSDTEPDACRATCRPAACGDGVLDSGEECDDGNLANGDGCDRLCQAEFCGNRRREAGEECDDGNVDDGDGCDSNCRVTGCGNGVLTDGEECDDGNVVDGDGCDRGCLVEQCGNGRQESNEECDDGNSIEGDGCDSNCTTSRCGNGVLARGEECDDGNFVNGDGCDRACLLEECGNGRREGDEVCDDGNLEDGDGCQANCTLTPTIDAVLLPLRPVRITLPAGEAPVSRTVRVTVRNVDSVGLQILRLAAVEEDCPVGTVAGAPDFSPTIPGSQDQVALAPGERAVATLALEVSRASMGGIDKRLPRRCTVRVSVGPSASGAVDGHPENNEFLLVVDVHDKAAAGGGEFALGAAKPVLMRVPKGFLAAERALRVRARSTAAGSRFDFAVDDGTCPPGTLALAAFDPVRGLASVTLRASRAFFTTPNLRSPGRCTGYVRAEALPDGDPANNVTPVQIDVIDLNDI